MNILEIDNQNNLAHWLINDNVQNEFFNCKLVETATTYKIVSLDDTITYLITPLSNTVIKYLA
jgi:hypothetical protein